MARPEDLNNPSVIVTANNLTISDVVVNTWKITKKFPVQLGVTVFSVAVSELEKSLYKCVEPLRLVRSS